MTEPDAVERRDTVDHVALTRLQDAYADLVTRRAWHELAELYLPTCTLHLDTVTAPARDLTGPTAVGEFIAWVRDQPCGIDLMGPADYQVPA